MNWLIRSLMHVVRDAPKSGSSRMRRNERRQQVSVTADELTRFDAWDPFLFTSPRAVDDFNAGMFAGSDGRVRTLSDLRWDLETEVVRRGAWSDEELQFRALLDKMVVRGLIEETGNYWQNSPHGVIYRIKETAKIRLGRRTFRLAAGRELVFQCRMARRLKSLRGPFLIGTFVPATTSLLCGEMANVMLARQSRSFAASTYRPSQDHTPRPSLSTIRSVSTRSMFNALWYDEGEGPEFTLQSRSPIVLPEVQIEETPRVVYLLIDVSASMDGIRLAAAKRALLTFLRVIPTDGPLRVVFRAFNTRLSRLQGSLTACYTPEARASLMRTAAGL